MKERLPEIYFGGQGERPRPRPKIQGSQHIRRIEKEKVKNQIVPKKNGK